ncbi:hypothetical protein [Candidatus Hecatella orcuttiae]|jgi:hypothetical protein|nr:hypothetical protein [Candidatus Hecatella orcuttiae]
MNRSPSYLTGLRYFKKEGRFPVIKLYSAKKIDYWRLSPLANNKSHA